MNTEECHEEGLDRTVDRTLFVAFAARVKGDDLSSHTYFVKITLNTLEFLDDSRTYDSKRKESQCVFLRKVQKCISRETNTACSWHVHAAPFHAGISETRTRTSFIHPTFINSMFKLSCRSDTAGRSCVF